MLAALYLITFIRANDVAGAAGSSVSGKELATRGALCYTAGPGRGVGGGVAGDSLRGDTGPPLGHKGPISTEHGGM